MERLRPAPAIRPAIPVSTRSKRSKIREDLPCNGVSMTGRPGAPYDLIVVGAGAAGSTAAPKHVARAHASPWSSSGKWAAPASTPAAIPRRRLFAPLTRFMKPTRRPVWDRGRGRPGGLAAGDRPRRACHRHDPRRRRRPQYPGGGDRSSQGRTAPLADRGCGRGRRPPRRSGDSGHGGARIHPRDPRATRSGVHYQRRGGHVAGVAAVTGHHRWRHDRHGVCSDLRPVRGGGHRAGQESAAPAARGARAGRHAA